jgi:hypothetical protein
MWQSFRGRIILKTIDFGRKPDVGPFLAFARKSSSRAMRNGNVHTEVRSSTPKAVLTLHMPP